MNWIDPKNELPEEFESVLVYDGCSVFIAHLEYTPDEEWIRDIDDTCLKIKYWCPMPYPPRK